MSSDDPFAFLAAPENKQPPVKKPHWREKLFSRDKGNKNSADQQVEAFLGPSRSKSLSHGASVPRGLGGAASKWPSPHDVLNSAANVPEAYPGEGTAPMRTHRPRKGLNVSFTTHTPEVIGEGGDESEVPTIEVSIRRNRVRSQSMPQTERSPGASVDRLPLDAVVGDSRTSSPRKNSDNAVDGNNKPPLLQNPQDADFLMTLNVGERGSRLSFRASPESNSFAQRIRQKMQMEEGRALQNRTEDPDPPSPVDGASTGRERAISQGSVGSNYNTHSIPVPNPVPPVEVLDVAPGPEPEAPGSAGAEPPLPEPTLPFGIKPANTGAPLHRSPTKAVLPSQRSMDSVATEASPPRSNSRDTQEIPYHPQPPRLSIRGVANQLGDSAFTEFQDFVARYNDTFRLAAESVKPLMETSLAEWMRCAVWWFLRGRKALEAYARTRPSSGSPGVSPRAPPLDPRQAVLDLGKALWINETIFTQHEELTRYGEMSVDALQEMAVSTGDKQLGDILALHQGILNHLRSLAMSIKRNNILTIITMSEAEPAENLETGLWVRYPFFAPDVSAVLSGAARSMLVDRSGNGPSMMTMMPLSDTTRYFSYGSMFVDVCVSSAEDDSQQFAIPCALSILRDRGDWYVFAAINSQSDLVNVMIQSDRKKGPTWDDVEWQVRTNSMQVKLPRGFELDVMFQEDDFKMIWNIVKYTIKTEESLKPEPGESIIFENTLKVFQYIDPGTPKAFPVEPVERCRMRLFERSVAVTEGTGTRSVHQGFRVTILTSPKVKTLSNVRHVLGYGAPVVFGLLRGEDGAPALVLKVTEEGRTRSMLMTFHENQERTMMHSMLLGMLPRQSEHKVSDVPIRAYSIEQPADQISGRAAVIHLQFPAGNVIVIDRQSGEVDHQYGPTILSENLRAFIASDWGSVTDRINLGPGELKLGLDVNNRTGLSLYRPGQQDLTVSVAENLVRPEMPGTLSEFLQAAMVKPMIRRFDFPSIKDLHNFEAAVTGFQVLYDSIATSFVISRRRMVVPIYKKWEATLTRIQIVKQEKVVQLLAFFNDFNHGRCMNFVLKGTDSMESFMRSGKFWIRYVDAKFALPRTEEDPSSDFLCLDMPEYPIEHDDISIAFDSETDRTNFQNAAPGSVREQSRIGSLRR